MFQLTVNCVSLVRHVCQVLISDKLIFFPPSHLLPDSLGFLKSSSQRCKRFRLCVARVTKDAARYFALQFPETTAGSDENSELLSERSVGFRPRINNKKTKNNPPCLALRIDVK